MKIRRPMPEDVERLEEIATEDIPLKFVEAAVIEHEGKIISFGVIRSNIEAILYASGNDREKVQALKLLLDKAEKDAKKYGYEYLDILARDEPFAEILIKHFGFKRVSGVPLIKEL